jgi:hypothetical protein
MRATGTRILRDASLLKRWIEIGGDEPAESERDQTSMKPQVRTRSAIDRERAVSPLEVLGSVAGARSGLSDLVDVAEVVI